MFGGPVVEDIASRQCAQPSRNRPLMRCLDGASAHPGRCATARNLITRTEMDDRMIIDIAGLPIEDVTRLRAQRRR